MCHLSLYKGVRGDYAETFTPGFPGSVIPQVNRSLSMRDGAFIRP